jgi:integrase/recombinase XerD
MNFAALSAFAEEFLALRQAVARRDPHRNGRDRRGLKHREKLLRSFIAYWHEQGDPWPIRSSVLLDWVAVGSDRQHPYRDQRRFYVARAFLLQVRVFEPATEIPDNIFKPLYRRRTPHLFSDQDIVRLIDAVAQVRPCGDMRPAHLLHLAWVACHTGLRIGEAIGLTMEDARLDATPPHLLIHESKVGKSRYVVLHPSTAEHLRIYRSKRTEVLRDRQVQPFFINRKGGRLDYNSQRLAFVRLLRLAGIQAMPGQRGPSLHSFRHTFAVNRLTLWHRERREVQQLLPHLAVYLGHLGPENTYWYVSSTPELLLEASARFERQHTDEEVSR